MFISESEEEEEEEATGCCCRRNRKQPSMGVFGAVVRKATAKLGDVFKLEKDQTLAAGDWPRAEVGSAH